jgi:hypothetical protein
MDGQDVIRTVEAAFERGDLPPAADLTNDHCNECIETYRQFWSEPHTFVTWQEAARRQGSCVEAALLAVGAWRYYLPTLIVWCVRDTDKVDALVDNLVHELTPPAPSDREWFGPRSVGFSADQRKAITHFLEWYQAKEKAEWASIGRESPDDAADAIRYWSVSGAG